MSAFYAVIYSDQGFSLTKKDGKGVDFFNSTVIDMRDVLHKQNVHTIDEYNAWLNRFDLGHVTAIGLFETYEEAEAISKLLP